MTSPVSTLPDGTADLPQPYNDLEMMKIELDAAVTRVRALQDEAIREWPPYSEVRERLAAEDGVKRLLQGASKEDLLKAALKSRGEFWRAGGCLSRTSYRHAYIARLLLEAAYRANPRDMVVADELVETITSAHLLPPSGGGLEKAAQNDGVEHELMAIRSKQFAIFDEEIRNGRAPKIQDLIRVLDLAILKSRADAKSALELVEWMQRHAAAGGWAGYSELLDKFHQSASEGQTFSCSCALYLPKTPSFPNDFRYGRRLPSFRWPDRELILWGADGADLGGAVIEWGRDEDLE